LNAPDWELIIINDGSKDNTGRIIVNIAESDSRIKIIEQKNGKQGNARNAGIKIARGSYLAFLDADDLWLPSMLSSQWQTLQRTGADLVFAKAWLLVDKQRVSSIGNIENWLEGTDGLTRLLHVNQIPILTVLAKKEIITVAGGFTEHPQLQNAEDYHLWLKILMKGFRFYGNQEIVAEYRRHLFNATTSKDAVFWPSMGVLYDLQFQFPDFSDQIKRELYKHLIYKLHSNTISIDWLNNYFIYFYSSVQKPVPLPLRFLLLIPGLEGLGLKLFKKYFRFA
jgi:glycosyltransferase involved in cell wall biosynthesis